MGPRLDHRVKPGPQYDATWDAADTRIKPQSIPTYRGMFHPPHNTRCVIL